MALYPFDFVHQVRIKDLIQSDEEKENVENMESNSDVMSAILLLIIGSILEYSTNSDYYIYMMNLIVCGMKVGIGINYLINMRRASHTQLDYFN